MVDIMKGEVVAGQGAFLLREKTSYMAKDVGKLLGEEGMTDYIVE